MAHKEETIYYYDDPLKTDFGPKPENLKQVSGDYKYARNNFFVRLLDFVSYRLIMTPIAWFYIKVIRGFKVINKKALKKPKERNLRTPTRKVTPCLHRVITPPNTGAWGDD